MCVWAQRFQNGSLLPALLRGVFKMEEPRDAVPAYAPVDRGEPRLGLLEISGYGPILGLREGSGASGRRGQPGEADDDSSDLRVG